MTTWLVRSALSRRREFAIGGSGTLSYLLTTSLGVRRESMELSLSRHRSDAGTSRHYGASRVSRNCLVARAGPPRIRVCPLPTDPLVELAKLVLAGHD
jgi:hypothetical protein